MHTSGRTSLLKSPANWHFQFNCAKTFILTKEMNAVVGEVNYRSDCGILKRGKIMEILNPHIMASGRTIDPQKASIRNVRPRRACQINFFIKKN